MIDGVVLADEAGERGGGVHALVGAHRYGPRHAREGLVASRGQWLLDQSDPGLRAGGKVASYVFRRPTFVGVDDELAAWGGPAHRGEFGRHRRRLRA